MTDTAARARLLLALARDAIDTVEPPMAESHWPADWLRAPGASFVTLRLEGDLRGCIGTVDAHRALGDDVVHNAHAAAYRDSRFTPVTPAERPLLQVEVSVLSARTPLEALTEGEAARSLRPGVDGVFLQFADTRATFLPQVWESLPDPLDFLAELRRKARLPARFWHPDLKLSRYTVEKFR